MFKIYQENFQSLCRLAYSQYLSSHFTGKDRNRWRKFVSLSENAIWSILLKYQEIDVQIQVFTDEN